MKVITLNKVGANLIFTDVIMIAVDDDQVHIIQPNIGNRKGVRFTRLSRSELISVEIKEAGKVDIEGSTS